MFRLARSVRPVVACLLFAGCTVVMAEQFRFGWDADAAAEVRSRAVKRGDESTARYRVTLSPRDNGEWQLEFDDFALLSVNGEDATTPAFQARLGPLAALTGTLPSMRLNARGDYLGTVGLDETTRTLLGALPEGLDESLRQRIVEQFNSDGMQRLMQQKSGETWNVWVGAWNGLDLDHGRTLTGTAPVTVVDRQLQQSFRIEHLGDERAYCEACVRLRLTTVVEGPEVLQLVSGLMPDVGGDAARAFVSARSMNVSEVVAEPATLTPYYASSNTEVMLTSESGENHSRHDRKEFWFEWQ